MDRLYECIAGCNNDMICINQCVATLGDQNDLCPCGKFCESKSLSLNFYI